MKKGFTLVEVLAIIVILSIISLVGVPTIMKILKNNNEDSYKSVINDIILNAETYASNYGGTLVQISVKTLQTEGYLGTMINPVDNSELNGCVYVVNGDAIYKEEDCKTIIAGITGVSYKKYEDGEAVYFDVTHGVGCTESEAIANYLGKEMTNYNAGCMKFFAFGDDDNSSTLKLLLDHNTQSTSKFSNTNNASGPENILTNLYDNTKNFNGTITPSNYTYTFTHEGNLTTYTINYKDNGFKARLITAKEITDIIGYPTFDSTTTGPQIIYFDGAYGSDLNWGTPVCSTQGCSHYAWLFDYTQDCTYSGCNYNAGTWGYLTSDAVSNDPNAAWRIDSHGFLAQIWVQDTGYGVRPVIEVYKSLLD